MFLIVIRCYAAILGEIMTESLGGTKILEIAITLMGQ